MYKSIKFEKILQMLSDFLYRAPSDKMAKLLLEKGVPVYMYVLNTTIEAFNFPEWRKVREKLIKILEIFIYRYESLLCIKTGSS